MRGYSDMSPAVKAEVDAEVEAEDKANEPAAQAVVDRVVAREDDRRRVAASDAMSKLHGEVHPADVDPPVKACRGHKPIAPLPWLQDPGGASPSRGYLPALYGGGAGCTGPCLRRTQGSACGARGGRVYPWPVFGPDGRLGPFPCEA